MSVDATPWDWRPSPAGWCQALEPRIEFWAQRPGIERRAAGEALLQAADAGADWLFHPLCHALYAADPSAKSDLQLLIWTGLHAPEALEDILAEAPLQVWAAGGEVEVAAGRHRIADLAAEVAGQPSPLPIALDLWFESAEPADDLELGFARERLWRHSPPRPGCETEAVEEDVVRFFRTQSVLARALPEVARWVEGATHVVVPLRPSEDGAFNSSSQPELPGLIFADIRAPAEIAEALAHETAHQYFRLFEAGGPIVDPGHADSYASPLRREPRPLRGVFLAYHALAYICALFAETERLGESWIHPREMADLREKTAEAEATLVAAHAHLTPAGQGFFDRTREVARHGS